MGLFDKLFGRNKKQNENKSKRNNPTNLNNTPNTNTNSPSLNTNKKKQNLFITNSAEHSLGEIELGISGKVRVDGILAIAALTKIAEERKEKFEFNVMYTTLLEEGALTLPVVCSIGNTKYSLYFIYQEEDLLKYKDLVSHIGKTAYPNLIYFSSIPIYDGYTPKKIVEPFQLADLRFEKDAKIAGKFAMWWKSEDDPVFHTSVTYDHLSKMYQVFKGYETYLTGYVLRQTRILPEMELKRMKQPEESVTYVITAPEGKKVIMIICQEKGIRFLFPINQVSKNYRERFLKGVLVDFLAQMLSLKQHNVPVDVPEDTNGTDWFNFMSSVIKEQELKGETIDLIGGIHMNSQMN